MIMEERSSDAGAGATALARARPRLPIALLGNAFMRIAGGASVGLYLAANENRLTDSRVANVQGAVLRGRVKRDGCPVEAVVEQALTPFRPCAAASKDCDRFSHSSR